LTRKNKLSELLDEVERGGEIMITRHGKPVARLVANKGNDEDERRRAVENLQALRDSLRSRGVTFSVSDILALRDEGRR
jgi:antitoxin (DNA-binding transcriptional repressor) of toxin-antitoxin stability system